MEQLSPELRLRSQRIVTPAGVTAGEVAVRDGRFVALRTGEAGLVHPGAGERLDLGDAWLLPGFIDGHVHGGDGAGAESGDPDELVAMAVFHARHGTTALLPTLVPAPPAELLSALAAIEPARRRAPQIVGTHLEGPFLAPSRAGALDPAAMLSPDARLTARLLAVPGADVRTMTIAPELDGALELITALAAGGRLASLGHTAATEAEVQAAVAAGARGVTHLFNAMAPLHHREPGLAGAALDCPQLSCELIADGRHVSPTVMRIALRAAGPARIRLVTDAMAATGQTDGDYRLGSTAVSVSGGEARTVDGGQLAGSLLTMDAALRTAVTTLGLGVAEAAALVSGNPARALGLADRKGAIAVGYDADLTVLNDDLTVRATLVGGRWAFGP